MANTQQPSFAPAASAQMPVSDASSQVAIPGTDNSILRVSNPGAVAAYVLLGSSAEVSVTPESGMVVEPGETAWLTIGSETNIAAVTAAGFTQLNLTAGN